MSIVLCVIIGVLIAERLLDRHFLQKVLIAHAKERNELCERIQHPEIRQPVILAPISHDQSTDMAEMANVGEIVPEFVNVGVGNGDENSYPES